MPSFLWYSEIVRPRPRKLPFSSPDRPWLHCPHHNDCPCSLSSSFVTASCTIDRAVTQKRTDGRRPQSHHLLIKSYRIRHTLNGRSIVMRTGVFTTVSKITWRPIEHKIDSVQQNLPMCRLLMYTCSQSQHCETSLLDTFLPSPS